MGKDFQKNAPPALFHLLRVRAAFQPDVINALLDPINKMLGLQSNKLDVYITYH